MYQLRLPYPPDKSLPTMYDLPSENPEEPGLDRFHALQPHILSETCQPPELPLEEVFVAEDLNLYYDPQNTLRYKRPDWFLALGVLRATKQEDLRLSYVIWQEGIVPFLVVELLSPGTEKEDLGQKLREVKQIPGKWEVYEKILGIPYYVLYDRYENELKAFRLEDNSYQAVVLEEAKFWIEELKLGLGLWQGWYWGVEGLWLRWYDQGNNWIPTPEEERNTERQKAEQERQRAEQADSALKKAISRFLSIGLTIEQIATTLELPLSEVEKYLDQE